MGAKMAVIASGEIPPKAGKPTVTFMSYYVYILKSCSADRYYIGHSSDYNKRLIEHNSKRVKSTKTFVPWEIVYKEEYENKSEAFNREMQIKSYKSGEAFKRLIIISARRDG